MTFKVPEGWRFVNAKRAIASILWVLAALALSGVGEYYISRQMGWESIEHAYLPIIAVIGGFILLLFAVTGRLLILKRSAFSPLNFKTTNITIGVLYGFATYTIGSATSVFLHYMFKLEVHKWYIKVLTPKSTADFILYLLTIGILTAICEESLFRHFLQKTLTEWVGPAGIFVASAIFGALHAEPDLLWRAIPALIVGLLLGFGYYKRGLTFSIAAHAMNNCIAVSLAYLL